MHDPVAISLKTRQQVIIMEGLANIGLIAADCYILRYYTVMVHLMVSIGFKWTKPKHNHYIPSLLKQLRQ